MERLEPCAVVWQRAPPVGDLVNRVSAGEGVQQVWSRHGGSAASSNLEELVAGHQLLHDHAGHGDHGEAAVVDLLGLHRLEARGVLGLEAERVEHEVTGDARAAVRELLLDAEALEGDDREELEDADGEDDARPELLQRRLLVRHVRGHVDAAAEERMEDLADDEAEGAEHGDAAVLDLDLAEVAHRRRVEVRGEAERVEEPKRSGGGQSLAVVSATRGAGRLHRRGRRARHGRGREAGGG
eukprot:scaffold90743_cov63-Phaeocystis_antarctica.AAC.2